MRFWFFSVKFGGMGWGGWCWRWGWEHQPQEVHQGNAWVLCPVCIIPNLSGTRHTSPLGFQFIYTDEGLADLCRVRLRMGMRERSTAVGVTAVLTTPAWRACGDPASSPPREAAQPESHSNMQQMQSIRIQRCGHSFFCSCRCHFLLNWRGFLIYCILLDLAGPLWEKGNVCGRSEGEVMARLLLETGLMAQRFDK